MFERKNQKRDINAKKHKYLRRKIWKSGNREENVGRYQFRAKINCGEGSDQVNFKENNRDVLRRRDIVSHRRYDMNQILIIWILKENHTIFCCDSRTSEVFNTFTKKCIFTKIINIFNI